MGDDWPILCVCVCVRAGCGHPMDEHTGADGCTRMLRPDAITRYCICEAFITTRETETVGAPTMTVAEARAILTMDRFDHLPADLKEAWRGLVEAADDRLAESQGTAKVTNCVLCGHPSNKHHFRHVFKGA